ncbi:MAG: glycosyltransferase [Patescibacteria group bacterium]|nr:glycosyltransferase [Patescibacteria group bacterium]
MNHLLNNFTVGLPTYYGAPAIIKTVESILASKNVGQFRLIVTIDGNPLKPEIEERLTSLGVEVIFNDQRGGQTARIKQLINLCETEILILTQDDIIFQPNTISEIMLSLENNKNLTMIGTNVKPMPAQTYFEKILEIGVKIRDQVGLKWNDGDNYLMSNGRCLVFRIPFAKQYKIPEVIINSDAYLYFVNKKIGGKFISLQSAIVYNKSPLRLKEHVKQSRRFINSYDELLNYFGSEIKKEYQIPKWLILVAATKIFFSSPVKATLYFLVSVYVKIGNVRKKQITKRFWETDISTKR